MLATAAAIVLVLAPARYRAARKDVRADTGVVRQAPPLVTALVIAAAPAAGFPLFAGWRSVPLAADAKGAACQQLNTLRELRGGAHLVAVLAAGVTPFEAVLAKGGVANAQLFGYPEPYPDVAELTARTTDALAVAETTTDHLVAPALAVLDEPDRDRFVDLVGATRRALI